MPSLDISESTDGRIGTKDAGAAGVSVKDIPLGDIHIKENVRKTYTEIEELAESIWRHGLLQPITVYEEEGGYTVKTGHRRYKAFRQLYEQEPDRFYSIRCIVSNEKNIAVIQLVENVQREDLSPADLYNALCSLRN
jgi:ParB family chromosome partitioning protein